MSTPQPSIRTLIPAALCLAAITALSLSPGLQLPGFRILSADKVGHFIAYGLLNYLSLRGWRRFRPAASRLGAHVAFTAAAVGYGALMEWAQYHYVPGRFYEYDDMLANALGSLAGLLLFLRFPFLSSTRY